MPEPTVYPAGYIKHNPDTNEVAIRTIFPDDQGGQMANMTWLVCTTNIGARNARTPEVLDWPTLYDPASVSGGDGGTGGDTGPAFGGGDGGTGGGTGGDGGTGGV